MDEIGRVTAVVLWLLPLLLVAACVGKVLPRLKPQGMVVVTLVVAVALCLLGFKGATSMGVELWLCVCALVLVQLGWAWRRHSLKAHARSAEARYLTAQVASPAQVAASAEAQGLRPAPAPAKSQPRPTSVGHFKIVCEIGQGSMSTVYLGVDPSGRQVAIKMLALGREFEGDALKEAHHRFIREAETAARLHHPDIVSVCDSGEDAGLAYIAMECLSGHDLQTWTRPGNLLPLNKVLKIVARVADALAYAHSQGVVHRDVKPANVMVDLVQDTVKVTDFGIAHVADSQRTRTGIVLGTPCFMSPEQMSGGRIDGRSDIYSLGVMLFQLLTGRLPYEAESMSRMMYLIANEPAPDVRSIRPEVPEALANVVALALVKQAETRYADGHQMASDLRAIESWIAT
jgi:serine/threonine-protein kinase